MKRDLEDFLKDFDEDGNRIFLSYDNNGLKWAVLPFP